MPMQLSFVLLSPGIPLNGHSRLSCAHASDTWYLRGQMWADKLTSMQRRYKNDLISIVKDVFSFAFEFPVCIVDKNEDTWPTVGET